jgi:mannose-1-phosphate guanylyltransferase
MTSVSVSQDELATASQLRSASALGDDNRHLWAVVLAGGDGLRLRSTTQKIAGDSRPKQFCSLVGEVSLLTQTRRRIDHIVQAQRQSFVVSQAHERWYRQDLDDVDISQVLVQPFNRGTGAAIALGVIHTLQQDPEAVIALFPCDHYYADEGSFVSTFRSAAELTVEYPQSIVVIGAKASYAETEYGWIELGAGLSRRAASRVKRFWEKPSIAESQELFRRGCLWNTFVCIGRASSFLDLLCSQAPDTVLQLVKGLADEDIPAAYRLLAPVDFSREVLAPRPEHLLVLCDRTSGWCDLGCPTRLRDVLTRTGHRPDWLDELGSTPGFRSVKVAQP